MSQFNIEKDEKWPARAAWLGLKFILLVLSAATTGAFFQQYAGGIFGGLVGADLSPYLAAAAGVIVLDGGAVIWSYLRANHASTPEQMSIANVAAVGDLVGSLATTALYLALSSSFSVGVYGPAGELTQLGQGLHYLGLALIVAGIAGNFAASFLYTGADMAVRHAQHARQLAAEASAGKFAADQERSRLTTEKTLQGIRRQLPSLTDQEASQAAADYLGMVSPTLTAAVTTKQEEAQPAVTTKQEEAQPAGPFPNGRPGK